KPLPLDVSSLVKGMLGLLQSAVGPSVVVDARIQPNLSLVLADPNQLELAILNLTANARDAMPEGGAIIVDGREASMVIGLTRKRYVCVSVTDSGEGMDEATLARALEPF